MPPPAPGRRRERIVLGAGLLSSAALAWAALAPWGDAEVAGRLELERRAEQATELVRLAWERLLRSEDPVHGAVRFSGPVLAFFATREEEPGPRWDRYRRAPQLEPFDVLLAEVEAAERGRPAEALAQLEEALAAHPDAALWPEGLLRAIQLAVRTGDAEAVERHLTTAWETLDLCDARVDTSYVVLCALAAAPLLGTDRRQELRGSLVHAWRFYALPADEAAWSLTEDGWRYRESPRIAALARRVGELGSEDGAGIDAVGRRARAVGRLIGGLPEPEQLDHQDPWILRRAGEGHVLLKMFWGGGEDFELVCVLTTPAELVEELAGRVQLAPGLGVSTAGTKGPGTAVGEPFDLADGGPVVQLRHEDPRALVRAEAGRLRALRLGFAALAVLSAVAGAVTFRALRRERRLAELKSGFIAGVSHDLRSPLASILLMAENLEAGRVSGEAARARYFGAIRREAQRLRRLVDDVLDFSRIERGEGTKLALEEVDLPRLVDELAGEAAERVERAGGALCFERDALPAHAELDAEAVRRSVWNLVDNALAHSGSVEVSLTARAEGDRWLVLEVADRGRGVPPAEREALFRPFARLDGANGAAGGTGLGLSIVRALARAHGGDATLEPNPAGPGTLARLRLALTPQN